MNLNGLREVTEDAEETDAGDDGGNDTLAGTSADASPAATVEDDSCIRFAMAIKERTEEERKETNREETLFAVELLGLGLGLVLARSTLGAKAARRSQLKSSNLLSHFLCASFECHTRTHGLPPRRPDQRGLPHVVLIGFSNDDSPNSLTTRKREAHQHVSLYDGVCLSARAACGLGLGQRHTRCACLACRHRTAC